MATIKKNSVKILGIKPKDAKLTFNATVMDEIRKEALPEIKVGSLFHIVITSQYVIACAGNNKNPIAISMIKDKSIREFIVRFGKINIKLLLTKITHIGYNSSTQITLTPIYNGQYYLSKNEYTISKLTTIIKELENKIENLSSANMKLLKKLYPNNKQLNKPIQKKTKTILQ